MFVEWNQTNYSSWLFVEILDQLHNLNYKEKMCQVELNILVLYSQFTVNSKFDTQSYFQFNQSRICKLCIKIWSNKILIQHSECRQVISTEFGFRQNVWLQILLFQLFLIFFPSFSTLRITTPEYLKNTQMSKCLQLKRHQKFLKD